MKSLIAVALLFGGTLLEGASLDCQRPSGEVERMICGSSEITALDAELERTYAIVQSEPAGEAAHSESQRSWLETVRATSANRRAA